MNIPGNLTNSLVDFHTALDGIVRLSSSNSGSYSSVSVAVAAATTAAYSDNCTSQKKTIATRKQTQNMAKLPSTLFLPSRPSFNEATSPPNETPINAAAMSPSTKKIIAQLDTSGGETCARIDQSERRVDGVWRHPYAIAASRLDGVQDSPLIFRTGGDALLDDGQASRRRAAELSERGAGAPAS